MKKLFIILTLLLLPSICLGAAPTRQYSYNSGSTINPTENTANEDAIFTYLNAGVDTYAASSITGTALISSLAITSSGTMTFSGTTNLTGTFQVGGTSVTASAVELNKTDGLNSSTSELNILYGATLSTAELNYVDNVTSAIQTQLDGKSATTGNASIATVGTITTGVWTGTAIAVANGGTGSTTAANARTALGLAIGTDVQAYNSNLTAINQALTTTSSPSFTTVTAALTGTASGNLTSAAIGSTIQAYNSNLTAINQALTTTSSPSFTAVSAAFTGNVTGNVTGSSGSTTGASTSCSGNAATVTTNANLTGDVTSAGNATTIAAAKVITTMLKTATSEVSTTAAANLTFTGGQYCHYPQVKNSIASGNVETKIATDPLSTSYVTNIYIYGNSGGTNYAITLYHTASGEDYWLWILVDKATKDILSMSGAPDHPAYGNGGDFVAMPHPFRTYDINTQDIILVEKSQAKAIQTEAKDKGLSVLELVDRDYRIDFTQVYPYVPIHSGQFSPDKAPVLVNTIPNYMQIRKLVLMDNKDKSDKKKRQEDRQAVFEAEKILKENKRQAVLDKLKITAEEARLILQ